MLDQQLVADVVYRDRAEAFHNTLAKKNRSLLIVGYGCFYVFQNEVSDFDLSDGYLSAF